MLEKSATPRITPHDRGAFFLCRRRLRFITKRIEHDAIVCNEGTHWNTDFLPNETAERLAVDLERDHFELGFPALRHVLSQDLSMQGRRPDLTGLSVLALWLAVHVL